MSVFADETGADEVIDRRDIAKREAAADWAGEDSLFVYRDNAFFGVLGKSIGPENNANKC